MLHLEERLRMGDEIMKTYIYEGGFGIVAKSGVGSAIKHQKNMLKQADIEEAKSWKEADIVHINTVFPDSVLAACLAKMQGKESCLLWSFNDGGFPELFYRFQPFRTSF